MLLVSYFFFFNCVCKCTETLGKNTQTILVVSRRETMGSYEILTFHFITYSAKNFQLSESVIQF